MDFLSPLWLVGAAAIVIPIILHLRRKTPPEIIEVGSISDLSGGAAMRQRKTPRDLILLALRCLILALVAVALARPDIESDSSGERVAVAPIGFEAVSDSLRSAGVRVIEVATTDLPWSALEQAARLTQPRDTLVLVSPEGGGRWLGPRPQTRNAVEVLSVEDPGETGGPPSWQRGGATSELAAISRPDDSLLVWYLVLALIVGERLIARRGEQ